MALQRTPSAELSERFGVSRRDARQLIDSGIVENPMSVASGQRAVDPMSSHMGIAVLVRPPSGAALAFQVRGAETVGAFKARIAVQVAVPAARQRLVFAGRTLEDARAFREYNLGDESELMLVLRDTVETLRYQLQGKMLRDFIVRRQIGGKDPTAARGGAGYSLHGVCSYVYLVELRGGDGTQLAMKVLINTTAGDQSVRIREEQMAEYALLQDSARMPPHPNILSRPGLANDFWSCEGCPMRLHRCRCVARCGDS